MQRGTPRLELGFMWRLPISIGVHGLGAVNSIVSNLTVWGMLPNMPVLLLFSLDDAQGNHRH